MTRDRVNFVSIVLAVNKLELGGVVEFLCNLEKLSRGSKKTLSYQVVYEGFRDFSVEFVAVSLVTGVSHGGVILSRRVIG